MTNDVYCRFIRSSKSLCEDIGRSPPKIRVQAMSWRRLENRVIKPKDVHPPSQYLILPLLLTSYFHFLLISQCWVYGNLHYFRDVHVI